MAEILSHMCNPAGQGCFYLKSLLSSPLEYYTSKDLVCAAVRAFFRVLWDATARTEDENMLLKDLLRFVVSESPSSSSSASPASASEQAWVNFRGSSACERAGVAPAFPTKSPTLVFVNHLHAARIPRRYVY